MGKKLKVDRKSVDLDARALKRRRDNERYVKSHYIGVHGEKCISGSTSWVAQRFVKGERKHAACDSEIEAALKSDEFAKELGLANLNFDVKSAAPTTGVKQETETHYFDIN